MLGNESEGWGPMGSMQPSMKFLLMSGTNLLGSTATVLPNPLQLEHAPIGELKEKFCGSRDSYDMWHLEQ